MTMTKAEIVDVVAISTGLTKADVRVIVEGVFECVKDALAEGKRIELRGFGVFTVKSRKSRLARNPRTGTPVPIDKRYVPLFKASPDFQSRVDKNLKDGSPE